MVFIARRRLIFVAKIVAIFTAIWAISTFFQNAGKVLRDNKNGFSSVRAGNIAMPPSLTLSDNSTDSDAENFTNPFYSEVSSAPDQLTGYGADFDNGETSVPIDEGLGKMGLPVILPLNISEEVKRAIDESRKKYCFNEYVSSMVSVHRQLPDFRDPWCKEPGRFHSNLPVTDVIICFYNEAWSTLLRTVHSVLDRSPAHLIGNILLVDDFSDLPHTQKKLEHYFLSYPKVKIIRTTKREGLIRAKVLGARHATSPILTFLDAHCECTEGWLEPLLDRIARNWTTVVCPVLDNIDGNTLECTTTTIWSGGFDWNLNFYWTYIPEREVTRRKNQSEPFFSPVMVGGVFSINRTYFEYLGAYDPGFDVWGAENLELSFKTWMCGGTLEILPCSHVGHVDRKGKQYEWTSGWQKNNVRLAEVWLDEYADIYFHRIAYRKGDFGDISQRKALRQRLGCKSFKWYLDNIFPEQFIPVKCGAIGNTFTSMCFDAGAGEGKAMMPYSCHELGGNQFFMVTKKGEIRQDGNCLDYMDSVVITKGCHGGMGTQSWSYNNETKQIRSAVNQKCIEITQKKDKVVLADCSVNQLRQLWTFK